MDKRYITQAASTDEDGLVAHPLVGNDKLGMLEEKCNKREVTYGHGVCSSIEQGRARSGLFGLSTPNGPLQISL